MEHTRATKSWSKHNVPLDLWQEILSWLPGKSVLRFRCVTKSWKRLIEDPDFCYIHRNRFKNNTDETHLLCFEEGRYGHIRCSETFETTGRPFKDYSSDWFISILFDGLVLLKSYRDDLLLWNPSIRKCRRLPPLSYPLHKNTIELGLGFDPLARDYKLLSMCLRKSVKRPVAIYTAGTNSWTSILFQARGYHRPSWEAKGESWLARLKWESVNYKGCLYFISRNGKELVSFDLSKMVFTFANLPEYESTSTCCVDHSLVLVDGGRSLAVFQASAFQSSLWALESSSSDATTLRWAKRYTFTQSVPNLLYLKRNGDAVFTYWGSQLRSYNIETKASKVIPKTICSTSLSHVGGYNESLVLIHDRGVIAPTCRQTL